MSHNIDRFDWTVAYGRRVVELGGPPKVVMGMRMVDSARRLEVALAGPNGTEVTVSPDMPQQSAARMRQALTSLCRPEP